MRLRWAVLTGAMLLMGCDKGAPQPNKRLPQGEAHLILDGVNLFVPIAWAGRPWDPRPWRNGVQVGSGGWGQFKPWLGPIEGADPQQTYIAESEGQHTRPDQPDPFFFLTLTFEFPAPAPEKSWWPSRKQQMFFPFGIDRLTLSYAAASEKVERPYAKLLEGISPSDGADIGDGWRQLERPFNGRNITLRFDARDWKARGGILPRRLAASFSPAFWSHFEPLGRTRWTATFDTQNLPIAQWRERYMTADQLFAWLQTSPDQRDAKHRFIWWSDLRYRLAK